MDGEEYVSTRGVIIDDLREINFHDHVDKWCSISNTWYVLFRSVPLAIMYRLPAELEQLKAMVPSTRHFKVGFVLFATQYFVFSQLNLVTI